MGYPAFGKVKTIVLPRPIDEVSLKQYRELYGIDLMKFIDVAGNVVGLKEEIFRNSLLLTDSPYLQNALVPIIEAQSKHEDDISNLHLIFAKNYGIEDGDVVAYNTSLRIFHDDGDVINEDNIYIAFNEE